MISRGTAFPRDMAREEDEPDTPQAGPSKILHPYAQDFLQKCGLTPTPDAVEQLVRVFLPCLGIMCERPWDPEGGTWKRSGVLGILTDVRKKFERLWERGWKHGIRHDDSAFDLINYIGMYIRSEDNGWGEWGPPARAEESAP